MAGRAAFKGSRGENSPTGQVHMARPLGMTGIGISNSRVTCLARTGRKTRVPLPPALTCVSHMAMVGLLEREKRVTHPDPRQEKNS
jgi:hypothetical protein